MVLVQEEHLRGLMFLMFVSITSSMINNNDIYIQNEQWNLQSQLLQ